MKIAINLLGEGNKKIPLLLLFVCAAFTSALAESTFFYKIGATDGGMNWTEAEDDKLEAPAYIVYDMGNADFSILSVTFKNDSRIKPTPCKYLKTDADGFRIFEDDMGRLIKIKGTKLIIVHEMLHALDPFVPYIIIYSSERSIAPEY